MTTVAQVSTSEGSILQTALLHQNKGVELRAGLVAATSASNRAEMALQEETKQQHQYTYQSSSDEEADLDSMQRMMRGELAVLKASRSIIPRLRLPSRAVDKQPKPPSEFGGVIVLRPGIESGNPLISSAPEFLILQKRSLRKRGFFRRKSGPWSFAYGPRLHVRETHLVAGIRELQVLTSLDPLVLKFVPGFEWEITAVAPHKGDGSKCTFTYYLAIISRRNSVVNPSKFVRNYKWLKCSTASNFLDPEYKELLTVARRAFERYTH